MRDSAAGDNRFVVAKHDGPTNRDTEVAQRQTEINDLVSGSSGCHELGTNQEIFKLMSSKDSKINNFLARLMQTDHVPTKASNDLCTAEKKSDGQHANFGS